MEFPETVLATGKGEKLEVRTLESRGRYVICKYLDPKTMKLADAKRKLMLFDEDGRTLEYFIVPLKNSKRSLLISSLPDARERQVWNETQERPEKI